MPHTRIMPLGQNKNVFTERKRKSGENFANTLNAKANLDDIFARAALKYHVPETLLKSVAKAESNFDANAVSYAGAQGIMQLMPQTAKGAGVQNPFDPEQNIMGGAKILGNHLRRYGSLELALAAYNAGPGNVAKYGGVPPFKETQNYIKKIQGFMKDENGLQSPERVSASRFDPIEEIKDIEMGEDIGTDMNKKIGYLFQLMCLKKTMMIGSSIGKLDV